MRFHIVRVHTFWDGRSTPSLVPWLSCKEWNMAFSRACFLSVFRIDKFWCQYYVYITMLSEHKVKATLSFPGFPKFSSTHIHAPTHTHTNKSPLRSCHISKTLSMTPLWATHPEISRVVHVVLSGTVQTCMHFYQDLGINTRVTDLKCHYRPMMTS